MSLTRKIQRRMAAADDKDWRAIMIERRKAARERRRKLRLGLPLGRNGADTPPQEAPPECSNS